MTEEKTIDARREEILASMVILEKQRDDAIGELRGLEHELFLLDLDVLVGLGAINAHLGPLDPNPGVDLTERGERLLASLLRVRSEAEHRIIPEDDLPFE